MDKSEAYKEPVKKKPKFRVVKAKAKDEPKKKEKPKKKKMTFNVVKKDEKPKKKIKFNVKKEEQAKQTAKPKKTEQAKQTEKPKKDEEFKDLKVGKIYKTKIRKIMTDEEREKMKKTGRITYSYYPGTWDYKITKLGTEKSKKVTLEGIDKRPIPGLTSRGKPSTIFGRKITVKYGGTLWKDFINKGVDIMGGLSKNPY